MIPTRKLTVPPRKPKNQLQVNRLFDSVDEMNDYLNKNFAGGFKIVETWKVTQIGCKIELPEKK